MTVGVRGLVSAIHGKITKTPVLLRIKKPKIKLPVFLRVPSTDVESYNQIFLKKEYDFDVARNPKTIVDAGANCGLASIYFSNKFPDAKIFVVEPEASNLEVLKKNIAPYDNITCIEGAIWNENETLNLVDPGLGNWGFMTQERGDAGQSYGDFVRQVPGMTIDAIMDEFDIEHIDILKMDIEGAEREVFKEPDAWIRNVDALIVELHERMKPGATRSFYRGTDGFDYEWTQGENIYLAKRESCIIGRYPG